jgi:hypothetical protein
MLEISLIYVVNVHHLNHILHSINLIETPNPTYTDVKIINAYTFIQNTTCTLLSNACFLIYYSCLIP